MIKPLRDFLLIRPHPRSLSDILETPAAVGIDRGRPNMDGRGIAVSVGPGLKVGRKYQRKGLYGPLEIKEGDLVAFEDHKAYPKDPTDPTLLIMQASDCVVLEEDAMEYFYAWCDRLDGVIKPKAIAA